MGWVVKKEISSNIKQGEFDSCLNSLIDFKSREYSKTIENNLNFADDIFDADEESGFDPSF